MDLTPALLGDLRLAGLLAGGGGFQCAAAAPGVLDQCDSQVVNFLSPGHGGFEESLRRTMCNDVLLAARRHLRPLAAIGCSWPCPY